MNRFSKLCALGAMLIMSFVFGLQTKAQTSQVATLNHKGTLTSYYGIDALNAAYEAASSDDVITLSAGDFNAIILWYRKGITIRGAGFDANAEDNRQRTTIKGGMPLGYVDKTDLDDDDKLINYSRPKYLIEGIYFDSSVSVRSCDATFIKCTFLKGLFLTERDMYTINPHANLSMFCCLSYGSISNGVTNYSYITSCSCVLSNSYLTNVYLHRSAATLNNCIITDTPTNNFTGYNLFNCIFIPIRTTDRLLASTTARNCVAVGPNANKKFWENMPAENTTNTVVTDYSIFKTFEGTFNEGARFELTDEAKAKYPNLGMYAGSMPYNSTPSNPQITKFEVDPTTTADGKLKVSLEVKAAK